MTIPNTVRAWLIGVLVVSAIILAFVFSWNHAHGQVASLQKTLEQERISAKGQIVAKDDSISELTAKIAAMAAAKPELAAAIAKTKAAAPDATPTFAEEMDTGWLPVTAKAAPQPATPPNEAPTAPSQASAMIPAPTPIATCALAAGDSGRISVSEVGFTTKAGNIIVTGVADAYRKSDGEHLFGGPFLSKLSDASGLSAPSLPRWGFGVQGVLFPAGAAVGPGVAFPPARFTILGHAIEIDANANFLVGTLGAGLGAGAYARF